MHEEDSYPAGEMGVMIMNPDAPLWSNIPHDLVHDKRLSHGARLLGVLYITMRGMPDGHQRCADALGVSLRGLERFDRELIEHGWMIEAERDGVMTIIMQARV